MYLSVIFFNFSAFARKCLVCYCILPPGGISPCFSTYYRWSIDTFCSWTFENIFVQRALKVLKGALVIFPVWVRVHCISFSLPFSHEGFGWVIWYKGNRICLCVKKKKQHLCWSPFIREKKQRWHLGATHHEKAGLIRDRGIVPFIHPGKHFTCLQT